ncbi:MAG TPA: electron transport complex subunit RsxC [Mariprofundaceae bacterium]|nr:electron transport complex subunit RsxC [Mariprofundaceae bacterium]
MPAMLKRLARSLGLVAPNFHGGIEPDDRKLTAVVPIRDCPLAPLFIVPLKQHIGGICEPIVEVGERVRRGQKIARADSYLAAPVHAPTSGRVVKIEEHAIPHPSGLGLTCIFIEPDGKDEADDSLTPMPDWQQRDPAELRERARLAGLAGLGGAVFPTFIKLVRDQKHPVQTVILNGVECEPYLTNDHRLMLEHADEILSGLAILIHMVGASEALVAIEENKPDAIAVMRRALAVRDDLPDVRVVEVATRYPHGSEKQLIFSLTGKEVPAGRLPMHVGVLCQNVGTCKALFDAVMFGRPLTDRIVTVSGEAVPEPANLRVRLGTPMRFVFAQCGLEDFEGLHVLHGGPMMGERLRSLDVPVVKSSTGILAFSETALSPAHQAEDPCIRCGHCSEVCPVSLVPNLLADHCRADQLDKAEAYNLFDCIECGCCSYVCPSNIPLVHYFRYGKGQVAQIRRERAFAEESRHRSDARMDRLERDKAEKAARRSKVREQLAPEAAAATTAETKAETTTQGEGES